MEAFMFTLQYMILYDDITYIWFEKGLQCLNNFESHSRLAAFALLEAMHHNYLLVVCSNISFILLCV